jgi:hypothetical protein
MKRRGLELDFEGIVAGWDIEGQEKMAKRWRKFGCVTEWLEFALPAGGSYAQGLLATPSTPVV